MVSGPQGKEQCLADAGSDFQITGAQAQGLYVTGGATATLKQGASVNLVGDGAVVAEVDGNEYALDGSITQTNTGSVITNEADISSPLNNAKGFITRNQGLLINNGNIDFTTVQIISASGLITAALKIQEAVLRSMALHYLLKVHSLRLPAQEGISSLWMVRLPLSWGRARH